MLLRPVFSITESGKPKARQVMQVHVRRQADSTFPHGSLSESPGLGGLKAARGGLLALWHPDTHCRAVTEELSPPAGNPGAGGQGQPRSLCPRGLLAEGETQPPPSFQLLRRAPKTNVRLSELFALNLSNVYP